MPKLKVTTLSWLEEKSFYLKIRRKNTTKVAKTSTVFCCKIGLNGERWLKGKRVQIEEHKQEIESKFYNN